MSFYLYTTSLTIPLLLSVYIILGFVHTVSAWSTFSSKCSTPATYTNYISSADIRGTLDILWSCTFTLFICTWTVQHLNIPRQRRVIASSKLQSLKWTFQSIQYRSKWMIFSLIFPEVLVGQEFQEWVLAQRSYEDLKEQSTIDDSEWSLTHAFFANMGGFVLNIKEDSGPVTSGNNPVRKSVEGGKPTNTTQLHVEHAIIQNDEETPAQVTGPIPTAEQTLLTEVSDEIVKTQGLSSEQLSKETKEELKVKAESI